MKRGPCCYVYLPMGARGFFIVESIFAALSPCGGNFATFFSVWGGFFSQFKGPFFHVQAFLLRLSPYGGAFFVVFKSLSATFFSMWGPFCYVFLLMWGFFHYLNALLLRFSPFGGPFSPFKGLSATFFLYVEAFLLRFSWGGGGFPPFEGLSAFFCSPCGSVVFGFMGTLFGLPPLPKYRRGLMPACPLTPISSMQYNHSLTASCHFRDILKIVTKYFLIYIFAWLTIFKIRKLNENNIF